MNYIFFFRFKWVKNSTPRYRWRRKKNRLSIIEIETVPCFQQFVGRWIKIFDRYNVNINRRPRDHVAFDLVYYLRLISPKIEFKLHILLDGTMALCRLQMIEKSINCKWFVVVSGSSCRTTLNVRLKWYSICCHENRNANQLNPIHLISHLKSCSDIVWLHWTNPVNALNT